MDATYSAAKQLATLGFIVRDEDGLILGFGFKVHDLAITATMAELLAVLHGLQFASELGFTKIILKSDSKLTIQNITSVQEDYLETR